DVTARGKYWQWETAPVNVCQSKALNGCALCTPRSLAPLPLDGLDADCRRAKPNSSIINILTNIGAFGEAQLAYSARIRFEADVIPCSRVGATRRASAAERGRAKR